MLSTCLSLLESTVTTCMMTSSHMSLLGSTGATGDDIITATVIFLFQVNGFKNIYYPLH
jgi:hypothetical protein